MDRMRAMMRFVRREVPPGALMDERTREYRNLKKAVSGVVYLRNKLFGDLDQKQDERIEVSAEILLAVERAIPNSSFGSSSGRTGSSTRCACWRLS